MLEEVLAQHSLSFLHRGRLVLRTLRRRLTVFAGSSLSRIVTPWFCLNCALGKYLSAVSFNSVKQFPIRLEGVGVQSRTPSHDNYKFQTQPKCSAGRQLSDGDCKIQYELAEVSGMCVKSRSSREGVFSQRPYSINVTPNLRMLVGGSWS